MSIPITSTLGVPLLPSLQGKNVDEDNKSPPEQGKRTPTSAKSLSGLVKSTGAKAKPKTVQSFYAMSEGRVAAKRTV